MTASPLLANAGYSTTLTQVKYYDVLRMGVFGYLWCEAPHRDYDRPTGERMSSRMPSKVIGACPRRQPWGVIGNFIMLIN